MSQRRVGITLRRVCSISSTTISLKMIRSCRSAIQPSSAMLGGQLVEVVGEYLGNVGYAPDLVVTGFHPLDGARWTRDQGMDARLARLVAHHSCARYEARVRGLLDVLLAESRS